jgi:hypothetical protein
VEINDFQTAECLRIPNSVNVDLMRVRNPATKIWIAKMQDRLAIAPLH